MKYISKYISRLFEIIVSAHDIGSEDIIRYVPKFVLVWLKKSFIHLGIAVARPTKYCI